MLYEIHYVTPSGTRKVQFDHKPSPEESRIAMFAMANAPSLCALVKPAKEADVPPLL